VICERHPYPFGCHEETDLVITRLGPNRIAVMAALRGPMDLSPLGAAALVRGGTPLIVGAASELESTEQHLKLCGATTERWQRSYCLVDGDGAVA
jgi:hypothetical protein